MHPSMPSIPPHLRSVAASMVVLVPPPGQAPKRHRSDEVVDGEVACDTTAPDDDGSVDWILAHLVRQFHAAPVWALCEPTIACTRSTTVYLEARRASLPACVWAPLLRAVGEGCSRHNGRLVALDLEGSRLSSAAVMHLVHALNDKVACLQSVTCWFLGSTALDAEGLGLLVDAWRSLGPTFCDAMRMIGLTNNHPSIGAQSKCIVPLLTQFPSLTRLHLNHVGLTPGVWQEMYAVLMDTQSPPRCAALEKVWMKQNKALNVEDVQRDLAADATGRLLRMIVL